MKTSHLILVAALLAAGALGHGAVVQRWTVFAPDPALTERLHAWEVRHGDWVPTVVPVDLPTHERSRATARRYVSSAGGRSAVVTLISGIPGSVATHTPDVCYVSSGYRTLRGPLKQTLELSDGRTATIYTADFEKKTASKHDRVRVRWAWTADGQWVAPDRPRWHFARRLGDVPVLYKLYVTTPLPAFDAEARSPEDDPPTADFVRAAFAQFAAAFDPAGLDGR